VALIKVLLVDDDEDLRSSLCEVLEQNGFDITTAANVAEALKRPGFSLPNQSAARN